MYFMSSAKSLQWGCTLPRRGLVYADVEEKGSGLMEEQIKPWLSRLSRRENAKPRREIHS